MQWTPFHFEANMFFQTIASMEDWQRLREAYPRLTDEELLAAKEATYGGTRSEESRKKKPNYGFRWEHDGEPLSEFFKRNQMVLTGVKDRESPTTGEEQMLEQ